MDDLPPEGEPDAAGARVELLRRERRLDHRLDALARRPRRAQPRPSRRAPGATRGCGASPRGARPCRRNSGRSGPARRRRAGRSAPASSRRSPTSARVSIVASISCRRRSRSTSPSSAVPLIAFILGHDAAWSPILNGRSTAASTAGCDRLRYGSGPSLSRPCSVTCAHPGLASVTTSCMTSQILVLNDWFNKPAGGVVLASGRGAGFARPSDAARDVRRWTLQPVPGRQGANQDGGPMTRFIAIVGWPGWPRRRPAALARKPPTPQVAQGRPLRRCRLDRHHRHDGARLAHPRRSRLRADQPGAGGAGHLRLAQEQGHRRLPRQLDADHGGRPPALSSTTSRSR